FEIIAALTPDASLGPFITSGVTGEVVQRFAEPLVLGLEIRFGFIDEIIEAAHGDFQGAALTLNLRRGVLQADRRSIAFMIGSGSATSEAQCCERQTERSSRLQD